MPGIGLVLGILIIPSILIPMTMSGNNTENIKNGTTYKNSFFTSTPAHENIETIYKNKNAEKLNTNKIISNKIDGDNNDNISNIQYEYKIHRNIVIHPKISEKRKTVSRSIRYGGMTAFYKRNKELDLSDLNSKEHQLNSFYVAEITKYLKLKLIPLLSTIEKILTTKGSTTQAYAILIEFLGYQKKIMDAIKNKLLTVEKLNINVNLEKYTEDLFICLGADNSLYCTMSECVLECLYEDGNIKVDTIDSLVKYLKGFFNCKKEIIEILQKRTTE